MSPMIPDCGVLTTPRRSPPVRLSLNGELTSPKLASLPYKSPPYSSEAANITLSTGFSFGFYKSAKSPVTPVRQVSNPKPVKYRLNKYHKDNINKGVSHKIKKPKTKSKELKKKTRSMKTMMKNLKDGNFTPSHWTPANRSPVKKTPNTSGKKKRHVLASPGVSFLDEEVSQDETEDAVGKKFFTSRSRASATVNISKNVMLAAKNGDISLKQRDVLFEKKNVGRVIEEQLDKFIQSSSVTENLPAPSLLPSVRANPRPMPTRVPTTPSPPKRMVSPKKGKKLFNPRSLTLSSKEPSELQDLEHAFNDEKTLENAEITYEKQNGTNLRRSPRKLDGSFSPKKSPVKGDRFSSPVRRSPRNSGSPSRTPQRTPLAKTDRATPRKISVKRCSTELNFSHSEVFESSPRKTLPDKANSQENSNEVINFEKERSMTSPKDCSKEVSELDISGSNNDSSSKESSDSPKLYPLFDRQNWHPSASSPKKNKSCHKLLHKSDSSQMIIDAGQKDFGTRQCGDCGVVYEIANQEDEASHLMHHNAIHSKLKYNGWKNENLVRRLDELGGRVVMVTSKDPSHFWRKVEEVLTVVDNELGFPEGTNLVRENSRVFMYILGRQVVGFLVGERIEKANRVIPPKSTMVSTTNRLLCCSEEQVTVWAGVSRIWVLQGHRGKGIASKLCEAMLCNMFSHHILSRNEIAFSDPTESGTKFAERFTGKRDFLVYRR
ncbi:N-acetyltransferase ESCO2-like [Macrobrachium nipponense]|uniref:N-acetyltransferase ESCO2-like n=1 Tax=Macrobrachium nipponense TaxID=159736 RepID=UPI0030C7C66C